MSDKKPRTNWSDKQRRVTGVITVIVIALIILLSVSLGKSGKSAAPAVTPAPAAAPAAPVASTSAPAPAPAATTAAPAATTPAPAATTPAPAATTPAPAATPEAPAVEAQTSTPVAEAPASPASATAEVAPSAPVASASVEIASSGAAQAETAAVVEATASESTAPTAEVVVESASQAEAVVAAETSAVSVESEVAAPAAEEVVAEAAKTYSFEVFSFGISGEYGDGCFTSTSETKGIVTDADIMGFAQYENNKYGALLSDVVITVVEDGFELSIPAGVDASEYIDTYQADIIEYVLTLFAEEAPVAEAVVETVEAAAPEAETAKAPYSFTVVDVEVSGEYGDKYFDSYIGLKGFVSSSDIQEFVAYEAAKYGDMLNGIVYEIVEDGIVLTIPEGIDAGLYLDSYKADIVEFLASVFTPVEGTKAEAVVGVAAAEAPAASGIQPVNYSFSVDGITVAGTIGDGCADAYTLQKGILTSDDIMGFVAYENAKYGSFFSDVYVTIVEDGFVLSFTEGVDVTGYAPAFEAEVEEYLASFVAVAPAEAAPEASAAEPVEVPAAVDNVRYKDVPVETEAEAPAAVALKEKTSSVKISLGLNGSVQTRVTREGIGDYWLRGGLNVEAKNIYMVGNFGFGARVDGTVALRSAAGWGTFLRDPSSWIHFSSYLKEASIDAMLMGYLNYDKVTLYGGLGVGYGVANVNTYMNSSKRVNILGHEWYQGYCFTGVGGLSYDINEKFALKVEGQARYVKTAGKSLSLTLGGSYTF